MEKDFGTDPWPNSRVSMAHDREPGWYDLAETILEDHRSARLEEARKWGAMVVPAVRCLR